MSNDSQGNSPGPKGFGGTAIMPSFPGGPPAAQQQQPQQPQYGQPPQQPQDPYGAPQGYAPPSPYGGQDPYGQAPPAGGYGYPQAQQQQYGQYGQYAQPYAPTNHAHAHGGDALPCPKCNQMTTSLKNYTMVQFLLFLWFFAFWRRQTLTLCPSCMRNELLMKTLINLIPANLLWVFLVLPWNAVLFCMTFSDGHSSKVRFAMNQR